MTISASCSRSCRPPAPGPFGADLAWGASVAALILHWIWGASLGAIYESSLLHHRHPGQAAIT
jgi:hypothetical protein